jgi:hypothetical protein
MSSSDGGSRPTSAGLSESTIGALRHAIQIYVDQDSPDGAFRTAVRMMCEDVHRESLPAEQLIIAFKGVWQALPEVQRIPRGGEREHLLERIVTMCVEEYYSSAARDHAPGSPPP